MNADLLKELVALCDAERNASEEVARLEDELKRANARLTMLREEDIPGAMQEARVQEVKLEDGTKVTVKDDVYCSISEANRVEAYAWLTREKCDGMIKSAITLSFGREDRNKALAMYQALLKKHGDATLADSIHPQTLKAFVNERLRNKQPIPLELFGARPISRAVVKRPKA